MSFVRNLRRDAAVMMTWPVIFVSTAEKDDFVDALVILDYKRMLFD